MYEMSGAGDITKELNEIKKNAGRYSICTFNINKHLRRILYDYLLLAN